MKNRTNEGKYIETSLSISHYLTPLSTWTHQIPIYQNNVTALQMAVEVPWKFRYKHPGAVKSYSKLHPTTPVQLVMTPVKDDTF
jgi:hypothetical protein